MENKIIAGLIAIVAIVVAVIFAGCITQLPSPDAPSPDVSPSEIVETFASWHRDGNLDKCYSYWMSTEYRNSTNKTAYRDKIKRCKDYYLIKVKSEEIDGDRASVEIEYVVRTPYYVENRKTYEWINRKSKPVILAKEEVGWRLTDLHCELKSK